MSDDGHDESTIFTHFLFTTRTLSVEAGGRVHTPQSMRPGAGRRDSGRWQIDSLGCKKVQHDRRSDNSILGDLKYGGIIRTCTRDTSVLVLVLQVCW